MFCSKQFALGLATAIAIAFSSVSASKGLPYVDQDGNMKCCIKPDESAPTPAADEVPYIDQDGNMKCCIKRRELPSSFNLKNGGMPYVGEDGTMKCCIHAANSSEKKWPVFLPTGFQ